VRTRARVDSNQPQIVEALRATETAKQDYIRNDIILEIRSSLERLCLGEMPNQATVKVPTNRSNFANEIVRHIPNLVGENARLAGEVERLELTCQEGQERLVEFRNETDKLRAALELSRLMWAIEIGAAIYLWLRADLDQEPGQ
jgi:predicted nuclease with TOPRIM domain